MAEKGSQFVAHTMQPEVQHKGEVTLGLASTCTAASAASSVRSPSASQAQKKKHIDFHCCGHQIDASPVCGSCWSPARSTASSGPACCFRLPSWLPLPCFPVPLRVGPWAEQKAGGNEHHTLHALLPCVIASGSCVEQQQQQQQVTDKCQSAPNEHTLLTPLGS